MYQLYLLLTDGDIPGGKRDKPTGDTHDVQQVSTVRKKKSSWQPHSEYGTELTRGPPELVQHFRL